MKKCILILVILFSANSLLGQNFKEILNSEFKTPESYKTQENNVLESANFLFNTSFKKNDANRTIAIQFIMKWMQGTPDHTFSIGEKAMTLTKGSSDLFGLYMAAITKAVLDIKDKKLNDDIIYNRAEDILVNYCSNSDNKMKPSKKIKKILKKRKL